MDTIAIDGLDEHDFRRSIETMLRHGEADEAACRLRALLEPYAGAGGILPERFLTVTARDVALAGWSDLGPRITELDRPHHPISAVSIAMIDPGDPHSASPHIATSYYSDDAYPFSDAARGDLLEGYSLYGCEWQGNFETCDTTLSVEGLDDLFAAVTQLEARLLKSDNPGVDDIRAGTIAACYLSVLLHQAVRDCIARAGLPRALCVMAGSDGVYPFFDAPVISSEEWLEAGGNVTETVAAAPAEAETSPAAEPAYQSLLGLQPRTVKKKPVLMLAPDESDGRDHMQELAAEALGEPAPIAVPEPVFAEPEALLEPEPEPELEAELGPELVEATLPEPEPEPEPIAELEPAPIAEEEIEALWEKVRAERLEAATLAEAEPEEPEPAEDIAPPPSPQPAPQGHSLRARFTHTIDEPEPPPLLERVLTWFGGLLGRRR